MKKFYSNNKLLIIALVLLLGLFLFDSNKGIEATKSAVYNFKSVGMILPPIFILIGLLDVWVPKEVMVKFMGHGSGLKGGAIAVFLGAVGAGPLVVSFPIAALLIKKGARLAYVFLFLGAWTSVKLPIFMFELANFGYKFTTLHVISSMTIYYIGAIILEKTMSPKAKAIMEEKANKYA
ncbi:MAG: permease [Clostridia bacterium]|nr:permease [Clostridia bacterium]